MLRSAGSAAQVTTALLKTKQFQVQAGDRRGVVSANPKWNSDRVLLYFFRFGCIRILLEGCVCGEGGGVYIPFPDPLTLYAFVHDIFARYAVV